MSIDVAPRVDGGAQKAGPLPAPAPGGPASAARAGGEGDATPTVIEEDQPLGPGAAAAVLLSGAAAAWMTGGLFSGGWARLVPMVGLLVGVGVVALSYRTRRPGALQYMVLPLAMVAAAAATFVGTSGTSLGDLPDVVADALRAGGLGQPPVPFDPGWRFVLVVVFAVVGAAAASLALGLNRVNVGVFVPVPILFGTALIQPKAGSLVASVVSLVLLVAAIAVAYGAELARQGATTGQFELRRLTSAAAVLVVLAVAVIALNQAGFLFPEIERDIATAPKKPAAEALASDRVLFTVRSDVAGPWRIGVLDIYRDNAFLLPPFDRSRLDEVASDGRVSSVRLVPGRTATATITLVGVEGHQIPDLPNTQKVTAEGFDVAYDPRTQLLRLPDKGASSGMSYVVDAVRLPAPEQLSRAGPPPPAVEEFTDAPAPPPAVRDLLAAAPTTSQWERLAFVRGALHEKVTTARAGQPVDVPPSRVVEMLGGGEGTPFEITAAEVLLARWAGVPARLGYGYFGGERRGEVLEIHPRQGATWLEAYFDGYGWVPLTDVPERAKGSLSKSTKQANPNVLPSDQLALTVYVPVKHDSIRQLYDHVRYWLLVSLPFLLAAVLAWRSYPVALRGVRRARRRRWAAKRGPAGRIAVAYAEFRDAAHDLNVGNGRSTPLEFVDVLEPDDEHAELSWLVTRGLWGDLGRDLRPEDAEAAEEMADSLSRRLRKAQPATARLLAAGSTASLREPYTCELPNAWPSSTDGMAGSGAGSAMRRHPGRTGLLAAVLVLALVVGAAVAGGAFDRGEDDVAGPPAAVTAAALPDRLVPAGLPGLQFQPEPSADKAFARVGRSSLVSGGRVFTVRQGGDVLGYLQVAAFEPGVDGEEREVQRGILEELGSGRFQPQRVGPERIFFSALRDQIFRVWFPPGGRYFEIFVARQSFADADRVLAAVIEYQRTGQAPAELRPSPLPHDVRRGGDAH